MASKGLKEDGGVTAQLFFSPAGTDWRRIGRRLGIRGEPRLYGIRNGKLRQDWETMQRRLLPILYRTVETMIRTQSIGDLAQLYGNLEKWPSRPFFKTRSEHAISTSLYFQSLRRLKMAGHPCPARAP